jgi:hypothetical protein
MFSFLRFGIEEWIRRYVVVPALLDVAGVLASCLRESVQRRSIPLEARKSESGRVCGRDRDIIASVVW